jgi:hypothetical protein
MLTGFKTALEAAMVEHITKPMAIFSGMT